MKFTRGHNSVKNVGGVTELVLCTASDDILYLYQILQKYLYFVDTISRLTFTKGHNFVKILGGVTRFCSLHIL